MKCERERVKERERVGGRILGVDFSSSRSIVAELKQISVFGSFRFREKASVTFQHFSFSIWIKKNFFSSPLRFKSSLRQKKAFGRRQASKQTVAAVNQ